MLSGDQCEQSVVIGVMRGGTDNASEIKDYFALTAHAGVYVEPERNYITGEPPVTS
jgi:hypothetical protein